MIIVTLSNYSKKIKHIISANDRWCYIGKDVGRRQNIATLLGEEKRFYLKDRLHRIAQGKRQLYLDFIAKIGKKQKDQLNWWASKFASKSPFHTDFFLLICYEVLVEELIQEEGAVNTKKLIIFIEDPWLFTEIKKSGQNNNARFIGDARLSLRRFFCFIRGVVYRSFLVIWFMLAWLLARCYHNGQKPDALGVNKDVVGIINPADSCVFKDGAYVANYIPGLSNFYEEKGIACFYIYPFPFPFSAVKDIGRNRGILWPLIFDAKFSNVIKRAFERWDPVFDGDNLVNGFHVSYLLEREKWLTFSKVGFNFYLILFDAFCNFFKKERRLCVVYLFENQPWEKMLCMAAVKDGIKTIGYQHSSISRLYVSQFIGKGEDKFAPLPDKIVTVGEFFAELYKEGGIPEDKIAVGGTWRYEHLLNTPKDRTYLKESISSKPVILVALPLDTFILRSMLENLHHIFSREPFNENFEVWLKPHPVTEQTDLAMLKDLPPNYRVARRPFDELLNYADVVIASTSTTGLEAFLYGKRVVSFIPENIIDPDPLLDITEEEIYKWYEGEDLNMDFLETFSPSYQDLEHVRKRYFSEIDNDIWLNLVMSEENAHIVYKS